MQHGCTAAGNELTAKEVDFPYISGQVD